MKEIEEREEIARQLMDDLLDMDQFIIEDILEDGCSTINKVEQKVTKIIEENKLDKNNEVIKTYLRIAMLISEYISI